MTEMTPVSNRLSIRYLDNFPVDEVNTSSEVPVAAPESFQNDPSDPMSSRQKTHQHSKEKVEQNESSNDASNETSDSENVNMQKPLTSQNLAAQNQENSDASGSSNPPLSSSNTSPPTGEDSGGKSAMSTEATELNSANVDAPSKTALPKKFFCKVCNQGFTRKHNMVSHEMIHTTIKLHRCPNCNLSFRRIHDLKRHEKLHTGEKPYHCESCDRSFARPDALTRHLNSPHACSGVKDHDESPQRTQTSNTSSSSYQASKLKHAIQLANDESAGPPSSKKAHTGFNEEQSLPLGSESSSASLLATGKTTMSDQDSGATSSGADRPLLSGPMSESTKGFYAPSSSISGDSNDNVSRPNLEINRWRSQQMHKGEKVSENIVRDLMQKQALRTTGRPVAFAGNDSKSAPDTRHAPAGAIPQQPPPRRPTQQFHGSYSPYHRSNASMNSMATFNKTGYQPRDIGRTIVADSAIRPGLQGYGSDLQPQQQSEKGSPQFQSESNSLSHSHPAYLNNMDQYAPYQSRHTSYTNGPSMVPQNASPPSAAYNSMSPSYISVVGSNDNWQQNAPPYPPHGNELRPSRSAYPSWSENNAERSDIESKAPFAMAPEYVRLEAYYELQGHADSLQMRITSLEQRMEMLEEKMKRDAAKLQKRSEKKAKKKSKKASTK